MPVLYLSKIRIKAKQIISPLTLIGENLEHPVPVYPERYEGGKGEEGTRCITLSGDADTTASRIVSSSGQIEK